MNFQGVVVNVADLNRSIDFYREVLGFTLLSQEEELAAMAASGDDRTQVIVLRAFGTSPEGGARHIGVRAFVLDVESADRLEQVASNLEARRLLISRRNHSEWSAVVGRDPDGVSVVVASHPHGDQATEEGWKALDEFLYGVGE
jgi:catechol 2,3-dioxygenase-like lactoylglutathione lyase family enzyme